MYTPRLFWHCIQRHTGSTWANQSAAADAGLHIVNAKGDPPISKTRLYSLVYAGLLYFIIGITTYSYTTVNHFDHFDPCRYLSSNPLFQTIQILSFFWFEILTSALFCFLTKYPISPAMKAGWNLYSNCIGFVPVSPLRTSSCSSVELSSGHHSRRGFRGHRVGFIIQTGGWNYFMVMFHGDIWWGYSPWFHSEWSMHNSPEFGTYFLPLILETQRLTALRDPFGDFRVPSVDFFIELCRFLPRREHSAAKAGWFQLGILQSCCAKDRCHLAYQCETHIERSSWGKMDTTIPRT